MKICLFTENYYKGGLDTFLINLINAWPNVNDKLTLVCNGTHAGLDTITAKIKRPLYIERYYRLFTNTIFGSRSALCWGKSFPGRIFFRVTSRLLQYPILFPWYVFTLMIYFCRSDYDRLMVVNGGYPASLLCRSALIAWRLVGKRPLGIMNFHNSTTRPPWHSKFFENFIDRLVISSASHIVSVSKNCLDSLRSRSSFVGCGKLSYIYNGIGDPVFLLKNFFNNANNELPPRQYCLMLATYENRKGHAYLLQAFDIVIKKFPNTQLQIFGHGLPQEKKQVADEVMRLKLEKHVLLGDFVPQTSAILMGASVLVVPSQSYESFGLTIIEAMAFSVPVVTTDIGGMPEVMGNSNAGYICSKDDPLEFAVAIEKILGDPALASQLGKNGRLTFESRFLSNKMASSYRELLQ
jgi:glycosyltransferase involved in cell wall biosynthesis